MRNILIIFIFILQISCKRKEEKKAETFNKPHKEQTDSVKKSIPNKWYGTYSFALNKESEDWRDINDISITISKDSIIYLDKGFQLFHLYKLSAQENNNNLKLTFEKALENTDGWALKKNKDFGQISFDGKNYNWVCPYVDISLMDGKTTKYVLKKK